MKVVLVFPDQPVAELSELRPIELGSLSVNVDVADLLNQGMAIEAVYEMVGKLKDLLR